MNSIWLAAGVILGLLNTGSQWWIIQKINPEQDRIIAMILVLGSGTIRIALTAAVILLALLQGLLPGIMFLAGQTATRWFSLYIMNKKQNETGK